MKGQVGPHEKPEGKGTRLSASADLKRETAEEGAPVHLHPGIKTYRAKQLKKPTHPRD